MQASVVTPSLQTTYFSDLPPDEALKVTAFTEQGSLFVTGGRHLKIYRVDATSCHLLHTINDLWITCLCPVPSSQNILYGTFYGEVHQCAITDASAKTSCLFKKTHKPSQRNFPIETIECCPSTQEIIATWIEGYHPYHDLHEYSFPLVNGSITLTSFDPHPEFLNPVFNVLKLSFKLLGGLISDEELYERFSQSQNQITTSCYRAIVKNPKRVESKTSTDKTQMSEITHNHNYIILTHRKSQVQIVIPVEEGRVIWMKSLGDGELFAFFLTKSVYLYDNVLRKIDLPKDCVFADVLATKSHVIAITKQDLYLIPSASSLPKLVFKRIEMGCSTLPSENFKRISAHPTLPLAVLHFEKGTIALVDFSKLPLTPPPPSSTLSAAAAASPEPISSSPISFPEVKERVKIHDGQTAKVYKGMYQDKEIAFKVYRFAFNDKILSKAQAEQKIWQNLDHPHIIKLIDAFESDKKFGLVLEWQPQNLSQLYQERKLTDSERKTLTKDIANGLHYLHSQTPSILHRDIRGTNILITIEIRAKLTDFGMSRTLSEGVDEHRTVTTHSPDWSAPELVEDMNSVASDIYALGMTLLEMTKREIPYSHYTDIHRAAKIFRDLKNGTQPSYPSDDVLNPIFLKCCALNPTDRFATADAVRQAIENLTT